MTYQDAAKAAMQCQDACNLSGVVFTFAQAMQAVCDESHRLGKGTEWKNAHPIVRAFVSKLNSLSREQESSFLESWDRCEAIAARGEFSE